MSKGYVYVLSNPSMPGIVKIGYSKHGGEHRGREFYKNGTGFPTPYEPEFDLPVENARQVERNVHLALDEYRVNKKNEWFKCRVGVAITEILRYGMPDFDVEILQWPDHLDIRSVWVSFRDNQNPKLVNRGYYPVAQEHFAEAAYRSVCDFGVIEKRLDLVRDPNHMPSDLDRIHAKSQLKGLMEMLAEDDE